MLDKHTAVESKYHHLSSLLADPGVQADPSLYRTHAKALAEIEPLVQSFQQYKVVLAEIEQAQELLKGQDSEMRELAEEELRSLKPREEQLLADLKVLL